MKTPIKFIAFFCGLFFLSACTTPTEVSPVEKSPEKIKITGEVTGVQNGKDGYTADVKTENNKIYQALVSIVNLGGPDNYQRMEIGDETTLQGTPRNDGSANYLQVSKIVEVKSTDKSEVIYSKAFGGVPIGAIIERHTDQLKKDVMKNGEGEFTIYRFTQGKTQAYCLTDPRDKTLVGNIYITSTPARTEQGIQIGSNFGDLLKHFPDIEVHGSEIEGRTYATKNNLSYRLDVPNFTYEVNKSKIQTTTKIIEIRINH